MAHPKHRQAWCRGSILNPLPRVIFFFSAARGSKGLRRERRGEPRRPCAGGLDRLSNDKACDMKWSAFSATFSEGEHVWFQLQFFAALLPASIFLLHTFFFVADKRNLYFGPTQLYEPRASALLTGPWSHTWLESWYFGKWLLWTMNEHVNQRPLLHNMIEMKKKLIIFLFNSFIILIIFDFVKFWIKKI